MLERYRGLAGIAKKVTPQVLRNTFARELERAGVKQEVIDALLGKAGGGVYPDSPFESLEGVLERAVGLLPDVWQE